MDIKGLVYCVFCQEFPFKQIYNVSISILLRFGSSRYICIYNLSSLKEKLNEETTLRYRNQWTITSSISSISINK